MNVADRIRLVTAGESVRIAGEGLATLADLERIFSLAGLAHDHLLWRNAAGAAELLAATLDVYEQTFHEPRYRPHPLLRELAGGGQVPDRRSFPAEPPPSQVARGPASTRRVAVLGDGGLAAGLTNLVRSARLDLAPEPAQADLLIVAGVGYLEVRRLSLRNALEKARPDATILHHASPWTVTEIASTLRRTERVVGFAIVGDPLDVRLVELAPGFNTVRGAVEHALDIFRLLGKQPVEVGDGPGLVALRLFSVAVNEAAFALDEGSAEPAEIDAQVRARGAASGPLEWADRVGLDVVLLTLRTLQQDYGDARYRPAIRLRRLVQAGRLGRSSGRGFY